MSSFQSLSKRTKRVQKRWDDIPIQMIIEILKWLYTAGPKKPDSLPLSMTNPTRSIKVSEDIKFSHLYGRYKFDHTRKPWFLGYNLIIGDKSTEPNLHNLIEWKKVLSLKLQSPRSRVWENALIVKHAKLNFKELKILKISFMSTNGGGFNDMPALRLVRFNGFNTRPWVTFNTETQVSKDLREYGDEFFKQIKKHPDLEDISIINRKYRGRGWGIYKKLKRFFIYNCYGLDSVVLVQHSMTLVVLMIWYESNIKLHKFNMIKFPKLKVFEIVGENYNIEDTFLNYQGTLPSLEILKMRDQTNTNFQNPQKSLKFSRDIYSTLKKLNIVNSVSIKDQTFQIESFKRLTSLTVQSMRFISGNNWKLGFGFGFEFKSLQRIRIWNCINFEDKLFQKYYFPNLELLSLQGGNVKMTGKNWKKMPSLLTIYISMDVTEIGNFYFESKLGDDFFIGGEKKFPKVEDLYVKGLSKITGDRWNLKKWASLKTVEIDWTQTTSRFTTILSWKRNGVWGYT